MKKILLTGANGMFGQDFQHIAIEQDYEIISTDIHNLNITDFEAVKDFFCKNNCDIVVHAAAYTNVDGAEENKELAFKINGTGTENLAKITAEFNIPIVYISTDYVFDGTKNTPYVPLDKTNPQSVYGASKLAGEMAVQKYNSRHYITRTSWLYGKNGKNFVNTMITLAEKMPELRVVNDQTGCPTWTYDLGGGILKIINQSMPYGIYHVCGSGNTTWYGFTKKIFEIANIKTKVNPCTTAEFLRPAKRPAYSVMDNSGLCQNWEKSLKQYLDIVYLI
ncbi:MAG: dTDP-4-dehydrorhamnose reductase [Candidatus Melainabacteria bacterium GWF2_37_15]|nr:MAG: dTDP-4-dehydrorhamnose reductase [Candidatus Melainabacteria bacterium GWF2_37_15]